MSRIKRFTVAFLVYLLLFSLSFGLVYGGAVLWFDDNEYALYTARYVYGFVVAFALLQAYIYSRPID